MDQTTGEQLRQARLDRQLTLEQVARATHIREKYLEALEAGDLDRLPSRAQARGFLRAYAEYLGVSSTGFGDVRPVSGEDTGPKATGEEDTAARPSAGLSPDQTQLIFVEIGQVLKNQRETLGFSIEEVERNTRIKRFYLLALEAGDLNSLPSPVQGRGMLFNYASFLGLAPDPLLLRFAEGLQSRLAERRALDTRPRPAAPAQKSIPSPVRRWFSVDFLLGGVLVLVVGAFIIWGAIRISALRAQPVVTVTVPSIAEELLSTPAGSPAITQSATPAPTADTLVGAPLPQQTGPAIGETTPEAGMPTDSGALVQVYLIVSQRAWMRVTVDGEVEFQGRVFPGNAYGFDGEVQVEVLTSNGAALQIFFNQVDQGVMGEYGEVVFRVFTPQGPAVPTPTITSTPTTTVPVTATQLATSTAGPTPAP